MPGLFLLGASLTLLSADTGAVILGQVRDALSGAPLAGAVVEMPDAHLAAPTDQLGRYLLGPAPPGVHLLVARFIGYRPRLLYALVPSSGDLVIDVTLEARPVPLTSIVVVPPRGEPSRRLALADRSLTTSEIRGSPLLPEPDVLQALGGGEVVLDPETPNGVHIRGGLSDQVGYALDGIPVFNPYHAEGLFSGWNPDAISEVQAFYSSPPAGSPDAASGVIEGVTLQPGARFDTRGGLSTGQARATIDGPLGLGGVGYLIAVRSAFPDAISPDHEPDYLRGSSSDGLVKLELPLLSGGLRLLAYQNDNHSNTSRTANQVDPDRNSFAWGGRSLGSQWEGRRGPVTLRVRGWHSTGSADAGWLGIAGPLGLVSRRRDLGVTAEAEWGSPRAATQAGFRVERRDTRYRVRDSGAGGGFSLDGGTTVTTLFADQMRDLGPHLQGRLGASLSGSVAGLHVSPRAQLRWAPKPQLMVTAGVARLHQFTQSLRNPESVVGNIFPADLPVISGRGGIPVVRSDQGDLGLEYRSGGGIRLGLRGYHRRFTGLVLVAVREGEPFLTEAPSIGAGTATGIAVDGSLRVGGLGITTAYGLERVRYTRGGASYTPSYGTTHLLQAGLGLTPMTGTTLRLGLNAGWGRRATAVANGLEWEACNLLDRGCEFGGSPHHQGEAVGATRLPPYLRVDLGVRREWHVGSGVRGPTVALYGTYTNLFGRINLLTIAHDATSGGPQAVEMRPSAPLVVGLDWHY